MKVLKYFCLHHPDAEVHLVEGGDEDEDDGEQQQHDRQPERNDQVAGVAQQSGQDGHGAERDCTKTRKAGFSAATRSAGPVSLKNQVEPA